MLQIRELSFVSQRAIASIPYIRYPVRLKARIEPQEQPRELGRLASSLKWQYKTAILADITNSAILTPVIPLPEEDSRYRILSEEGEWIDLAEPRYERYLFQVCNFAICQAFESAPSVARIDRKLKRIYSKEPPTKLSKDETSEPILGKAYLTFDILRDWNQHLVLVLDFANECYSAITIDQWGVNRLTLGERLIHTYDGKVCEFAGIGLETIDSPIAGLGNQSVLEYHRQKGNLTPALLNSLNPLTPVVKVKYDNGRKGKFEASHMPQLLRKLYNREEVDNELFNQQLMPIAEKVNRAIRTIRFLNGENRLQIGGQPLKFADSLRSPRNLQQFTQGKRANNLDFGRRAVSYPTAGVGNHYLLEKPEAIKAYILYPQAWESQAEKYTGQLKTELKKFHIDLKRLSQVYDPQNPIEIRQTCQEIKEGCDLVIAYVPQPGEPLFTEEVNPYRLIKEQLVIRKLPSQMITQSTLKRGWKDFIGRNIILGINAKLGYMSWQLKEMPGTSQAFLGLDIGRKDNLAIGAAAFLIDLRGQMIGWSNAQFPVRGETFDRQQLRNLLLDLVSLYQRQFQRPLQHLTIHRDGKVQDAELQTLRELKTELARAGLEELDVIEVLKSGNCRAVEWNPENTENPYKNPQKGYGWEYCDREAVILTTGDREAKVSPNSSPRPLRIKKRMGETDLLTLAEQVYWLSELQVGSTQTIRLPITTYYADRAAEVALDGLIPVGIQQEKRLWFL